MADTVVTVIVRARDEFSKTFTEFNANALDVAKVAGTLAVVSAAAAGGLVAISAAAGARANDLQVLGQRLALSTSEVDKLKFGAEQLDVSFGAVTSSIGFFQRTLFAARAGSAEAVQTLRALGFSLEEIENGLGGTQAGFRATLDRLRGISDEGTRAGLMFRVFGRGAAEIRPIVEGGTQALDEQARKLEELNAVVSVSAGVVGDEFGDAVDQSRKQVEALQSSIAEALLPTLTQAVVGTQEFVAGVIQFSKENPTAVRSVLTFASGLAVLAGSLGAIVAVVALAKGALATFGVSAAALAASGGPIALAIVALGALAAAFVYAQEKAKEPLRVRIGLEGAEEVGAELGRLSRLREEEIAKLEAAQARARTAPGVRAGDLLGGREGARDRSGEQARAAAEVARGKERIAELDRSIRQLQQTAAIAFGTATGGVEDLGLAAEKAKDPVQELIDLVEKLSGPGEVSITRKTVNSDLELRPPTGLPGPPFDFRPRTPRDNTPSPEIEDPDLDKRLAAAREEAEALHTALEQVGVDVANINAPLESTVGALEVIANVIGTSFRGAFDPLLRGIQDTSAAVFDFGNNAIATLDGTLRGFVLNGQKGLKSLGDGFLSVMQGVRRLIGEIIILTIRTLILRAISGFLSGLFGGGGLVDSGAGGGPLLGATGGQVRAYAAGGVVEPLPAAARFAMGARAVRAAAAGGLVLALAGGGEVVAPPRAGSAPRPVPAVVRAATGGWVQGYAGGGGISIDGRPGGQVRGPGTATSDDIPARLSDREFVVRTAVVERPGVLPFLRKLNAGAPEALRVVAPTAQRFSGGGQALARAFAGGGLVSTSSSAPVPHVDARETAAILRAALAVPAADRGRREAPLIENLTLVARDADSVRRDLAPGGRSYRQLERLRDEGRA